MPGRNIRSRVITAGVASRPGATFDAAELSTNPTLLVATKRKPVNGARVRPYGSERAAKLSVARAKLTPPSEGRFSLPISPVKT
ncbi:MAG: hypothetical protein ABI146_09550 [Nitrobacter sp.]